MSRTLRALGLLLMVAAFAHAALAKPPQAPAAKSACDMSGLLAEKESVLSDLRNGLYCNLCHRTKTEIEKTGENFQTHVGQSATRRAKPATPEMISGAAQRYDALIRRLCGTDATATRPAQGSDCEQLGAYRDGELFKQWDKTVQKYMLQRQARDDLVKLRRDLLNDNTWSRSDWSVVTGIVAANLKTTSHLISNLLMFHPEVGAVGRGVDTARVTVEKVVEKLKKGEKIDAITVYELAKEAGKEYASSSKKVSNVKKTIEQLAEDVRQMVYLKSQQDQLKATVREQLDSLDSAISRYESEMKNARGGMEAIEAIKEGIDQYCLEQSRSPSGPTVSPSTPPL